MVDHLRVNVFNVDGALAAGSGKEIFAAHGIDVEVTVTPNSTAQMSGLSKGSWQIVSTAFVLTPLMGPNLQAYYDRSFYREACNR